MKEKKEMPSQLSKVPDGVREILTDGLNYSTKERPRAGEIKEFLTQHSGTKFGYKNIDIQHYSYTCHYYSNSNE